MMAKTTGENGKTNEFLFKLKKLLSQDDVQQKYKEKHDILSTKLAVRECVRVCVWKREKESEQTLQI